MRLWKTTSIVLAILCAEACTGSSASLPVLASPSTLPAIELADEMAPVEFHGIPGVFISARGFNAMLVGFELEKGDIRTELAREKTQGAIAREENKSLRKEHDALAWRATWGLPLGIGIGVGASVLLGGILAAIFTSLPAQIYQALQR